MKILQVLTITFIIASCTAPPYDVIIKNGQIVDGSGQPSFQGDVAIVGDTIAGIGVFSEEDAKLVIDVSGLVVAPGFINMLSWAIDDLIEDGKSQSDIRQGVTLEVFGEGRSMGPLTDQMKRNMVESQGSLKFDVAWTTLGEYLEHLVTRGVSPNVASFVGATTLRIYAVGYDDRAPTEEEMDLMKSLVKQAMEEGALGIGSSLIYAPAFYSSTEELIEICKVAAEYDGMYISHLRSEGPRLLESLDELITIADEAGIRAEVYHLKQSGQANWHKFDQVVAKIDSARAAGLHITTDMYTYVAGATGLNAAVPPWVQEGGYDKWMERLQDPNIRARVIAEMQAPAQGWESLMQAAASPDNMLLIGFKNDSLKYLQGKTLSEIAQMRNTSQKRRCST